MGNNACRCAEGESGGGGDEGMPGIGRVMGDKQKQQKQRVGTDLDADLSNGVASELIAEYEQAQVTLLEQTAEGVGDHICPVMLAGTNAAAKFKDGNFLDKIFKASGENLGRTFSLSSEMLDATGKGDAGGFACAISDPTADDCPLVFVSKGFEETTGYTADFTTGRSCRFLQPPSRVLNDAFNLSERKEMRDFCNNLQPAGSTIINLLLNETTTGERFWNLLRMQYIEADGALYIFGVQTVLNAYMPKLIEKAVVRSPEKNQRIVEAMRPFIEKLEDMRKELRNMVHSPIMECKGYFTCSMNYMKLLPLLNSSAKSHLPKSVGGQEADQKAGMVEGARVAVTEDIKTAISYIPAGSKGTITSMTSFGNAVVEWTEGFVGSKTLLVRDFDKVKILSSK